MVQLLHPWKNKINFKTQNVHPNRRTFFSGSLGFNLFLKLFQWRCRPPWSQARFLLPQPCGAESQIKRARGRKIAA